MSLASTVDFFWVWEQISKFNNLLNELVGRSFCNTQWDTCMTSVIVEHSCSLSEAICNFLEIVIIIITLSQKLANDAIVHAWIYPLSTTKQRSSSGPCMFFFDCQLKLSIIHQTNIRSICKWKHRLLNYPPSRMSGSATWCGLAIWSAWILPNMRMLNAASASTWRPSWDTYFTSIQSWCKIFLYCSLVRELNILCMTVTWVKIWRLEIQYVSFANRSELFRRNLKKTSF